MADCMSQSFKIFGRQSTAPSQHSTLFLHTTRRGSIRYSASSAASAIVCGSLEPGNVVQGRVKNVLPRGATIELSLDGSVGHGFMPRSESPFNIEHNRTRGPGPNKDFISADLSREFLVLQASDGGEVQVSARELDSQLLWKRMEQMAQISTEGHENFTVIIAGANNGGLVSHLGGLPIFVPVSQLERKPDKTWWTVEELEAKYTGKELKVAILQASADTKKIVCSALKARENEALRLLEVGALVHGRVRRIEDYGVFVGIDGTRMSGLLHISNISRVHVEDPRTVFEPGEKVICLVMSLDDDFSNISLSTAEIEPEDGDIVKNKEAVWAQAAEQSEAFRRDMLAAR